MADLKSTLEVIDGIIELLRYKANDIQRLRDSIAESNNPERVPEVISALTGLIPNLRMDLLAVRPIRVLQQELYKATEGKEK